MCFVSYYKKKTPIQNILNGKYSTERGNSNEVISDGSNEIINATVNNASYTFNEKIENVPTMNRTYKECILFTSKSFKIVATDLLMKYVNSKSNSFFNLCENIYLIVPITASVVNDSSYANIKLIRILYPKPELFSILLPLNTDYTKDEILVVEIKVFEIKSIEKSINQYIQKLKRKVKLLENNEVKLKEYHIHQLRYFWLYLGLEFVENHLQEILSFAPEKLSKKLKRYEKKLEDTRCLSNYNNEDMTLIIRFFRRSNTQSYLHQLNLFDNSLKVVSIIQNSMYINPYEEMKSLNKTIELNYFWCTNWNSVFFLSRLLPLLYYNKYTLWCDDDEIFDSKMSNKMKFISTKYNAILGSHGIRINKVLKVKYEKEDITFKYARQIYGSTFFQTRWQVNLWRFRTYYKLWGDDIITELISQFECNMSQLLTINNTKILIGLKNHGFSTNMQNASMYGKGHRIMDKVIDKCTRESSYLKNVNMRSICFYDAYI